MRLQKPIVLLELKGAGHEFRFEDAFRVLSNLETSLITLNPQALVELNNLTRQSLVEVQETVRQALEIGRARGVPHFHING
jgi:hypothetical protein